MTTAEISSTASRPETVGDEQNLGHMTKISRWQRTRGIAAIGVLVSAAIAGYFLVILAISIFSPERAIILL